MSKSKDGGKGLSNYRSGLIGEETVADHFIRRGYTLLAKRHKTPLGEIDLIFQAPSQQSRQTGQIVFVEVKSRTANGPSTSGLDEVITPRQIKRLFAAIEFFMQTHHDPHQPLRLDLVILSTPSMEITHIENILYGD